VNATKFEVPLHASEREEQSEAQAGAGKISQGAVPFGVWARYNAGLHRTN